MAVLVDELLRCRQFLWSFEILHKIREDMVPLWIKWKVPFNISWNWLYTVYSPKECLERPLVQNIVIKSTKMRMRVQKNNNNNGLYETFREIAKKLQHLWREFTTLIFIEWNWKGDIVKWKLILLFQVKKEKFNW